MSRLCLMIFTLVIMITILCNHPVYGGNFHTITRYSDIPRHKQDVKQCLCWKKYDGEIVGRCKSHINHNNGILYHVAIPV